MHLDAAAAPAERTAMATELNAARHPSHIMLTKAWESSGPNGGHMMIKVTITSIILPTSLDMDGNDPA
jgi:hypothetical protein